ncbi:hypothetical protein Peur_033586 [Populus x canadensis]
MIMPRDGNAIRTAYFQLLSGTTMIRLLSAKGSLVLSRDLIGLLLSLVAMGSPCGPEICNQSRSKMASRCAKRRGLTSNARASPPLPNRRGLAELKDTFETMRWWHMVAPGGGMSA